MTAPRRYGWRKQPEDLRDWHYRAPEPLVAALPPHVDLRDKCPPPYDQGRIGSCTANAIAAALQFCEIAEMRPSVIPSRLFIYWNERNAEGTADRDAGAVIRDGIKVVNTIGACPESEWPYDDTPADPATGIWPADARPMVQPDAPCYLSARGCASVAYLALPQVVDQLRACLAQGFPFVFGFQVFDAFESIGVAQTGVLDMPTPGEACLGGHAVMAVGYDDPSRRFIIRNSWGNAWGNAGHFTMPYDYIASPNLASDFWSIRRI